jgi:hypothetical protein
MKVEEKMHGEEEGGHMCDCGGSLNFFCWGGGGGGVLGVLIGGGGKGFFFSIVGGFEPLNIYFWLLEV